MNDLVEDWEIKPIPGYEILNIQINKCKCEHPIKGEYIGSVDEYVCKQCFGVISGLEHFKRTGK